MKYSNLVITIPHGGVHRFRQSYNYDQLPSRKNIYDLNIELSAQRTATGTHNTRQKAFPETFLAVTEFFFGTHGPISVP